MTATVEGGADPVDAAAAGDASKRALSGEAGEALDRLRGLVDQASQAVRELTETSRQWTEATQQQASGVARGMRSQGERAIGTVSQQVEHYPLASIAAAMAVGFLAGYLTRR